MFAVLRIAVLAVAIALAITTLAWLLTGDARWRRLTWQVFKYAVFALTVILLLFAGEALLE
jgi:heme O synthase-like polyprenyltransferase